MNVYSYTIPVWAITPIEYGEEDSLLANEVISLRDFLDALPKNGHFSWPNDIDSGKCFNPFNDIDRSGADCIEVEYIVL